ncbi:MAG TPA: GNAT family N-acetyltransferase [Bacteroidota bacterium]|nr:GNAT family N-acetyltransferase [Bacteroidota bacterium]
MSMSSVTVRPVASKSDEKKFIKFQWVPYRGNPYWVPPMLMDRRKLIDRKGNPFYKHASMELFLAERDGEVVGRIGAIINDNHNREHSENIGFFGFFESIDDWEVARPLFDAARKWLKEKGVTAMRGPASPSVNDEYGLLIKGFDRMPAVLMTYNPPYYQTLVEKYGFTKAQDLFAYYIHKDKVFNEKFRRIADTVLKRSSLKIRELDMKRFDEEVALIRDLYSKGWQKNWGEVPMTEDEFNYVAKDLKAVVDPHLVIVAESNGKPVGFGMTLPDLNQVLIHNRHGWLIPGIIRVLTQKKKIDRVRIVILGVMPEYANTGIGAALFYETGRRCVENGYPHGEASWVNEDNLMMNRGAQLMQGTVDKTYRVYQMPI